MRNHVFDERDADGMSPIHFAISERQQEIAEFLVKEAKVDVNASDRVMDLILKNSLSFCFDFVLTFLCL